MTTKQIPIWIDCDTGTDDTVAIMLAHALPELQIVGLSAVAGNSLLCNTFPNTRRVVHLLGADYPVYPGAERPLVREPHVAGAFHGENGLGNVQLPLPDTAPEQTPAWDALYAAAKRMPGELRLVATGPLTNVAISSQSAGRSSACIVTSSPHMTSGTPDLNTICAASGSS